MNFKRVLNNIGGCIAATMCFFCANLSFNNGNMQLDQMDTYTGVVSAKGITTKKGTRLNVDVFYFTLKGLDQIPAYYNISQKYTDIDSKINKNDTLTLYYIQSLYTDKPNTDIYQIEKNGAVILAAKDQQEKEATAGYLAFFGGLLMLGITIYQDKKYWKK